MTTSLRDALAAGRFCYVVELVASALTREAQLLETASGLARLPEVVAGSITSYAGGALGHDPLRVAAAARARGLTPNLHLTCVSQDRRGLDKTLEDMHALSLENVFALTGDYPSKGDQPPVFDLDSVQLVELIAARRRAGMHFHVAVAVSPFKYTEADCVYQYLKLEKKIAAGADLAITQVGWDARKFAELKRYLDARGLATPLLGNVYVLGPKTAERMARGEPPGCWVSPALLGAVRAESRAPDGGRHARLERAARTVAVLRGLGYAGAYLGGTHDARQIAWIIRRAEQLASRWQELAAELSYGDPDGFYLDEPRARPAPPRREMLPALVERLSQLLPVTRETGLGRTLARGLGWLDRRPLAAAALERSWPSRSPCSAARPAATAC
jgi:methylenetetrahydrofolate reductase (NADPH)